MARVQRAVKSFAAEPRAREPWNRDGTGAREPGEPRRNRRERSHQPAQLSQIASVCLSYVSLFWGSQTESCRKQGSSQLCCREVVVHGALFCRTASFVLRRVTHVVCSNIFATAHFCASHYHNVGSRTLKAHYLSENPSECDCCKRYCIE